MFRIYLPNYEHDLPAFFPSVINSKVNGQSWLPKFSYLTADNGLSHTINPSLSCLISFTMKNKMIWLISLIFIAELNTKAQTNPGFEEGLSGWEPTEQTAAVKIVAEGVYKGKASVRLGHKNAELIQRISLSPLCLFYYDTRIKASDKNTVGYSFVRFYDKNNHLLIEYKSKPVNDLAYQVSSYYTESPALTGYVTIGVEKSEGTGYIYVDDFSVKTRFGEPENKPQTLVNLD